MSNRSANDTDGSEMEDYSVFSDPFDIACIVLGAAIVLINGMVIYLFLTRHNLRESVTNIFLFNLAISDFCFGAFVLPTVIACSALLGDVCVADHVLTILTGFCSIYQILLGIVEKYLAICHTMWHYLHFTRSLAVKLAASVWVFSMVIAQTPVWWMRILERRNDEADDRFNTFYIIMGFVLPVVTSAIMYTLIICKVRRQSRRMSTMCATQSARKKHSRLQDEQKVAVIFGVVFTLFLMCWASWFIVKTFHHLAAASVSTINATVIARYAAAILNPVLYTFIKPDFRAAFMSLGRSKRESRYHRQTGLVAVQSDNERNGDALKNTPL